MAATNSGSRALHDLLVEPRRQLVVEFLVAEQIARFQKRGADGHVGLGLPNAFVDRTGGVADFQAHVPQAIEQRLGDLLAPGGLLVRQQKKQIDVGARREQAAPITAGGDHRHALGLRRNLRRIKLGPGKIEQDADDLILHPAQPLGAEPAVAVLQQQLFGVRAGRDQRRLEALRHRRAQFALASGKSRGERLKVGGDRRGIDQFDAGAVRSLDVEHRDYA